MMFRNFFGTDERIQQIQLRATSYGFFFMIVVSFAFSAYKLFSLGEHPSWADLGEICFSIAIWFGGLAVFTLYSSKQGLFRMMREEVNATQKRRQRIILAQIVGAVVTFALMFAAFYFLHNESLIVSLFVAGFTTFFTVIGMQFTMWRKLKSKDQEEEQ